MPWKESYLVNERMRFVVRLENGERMTDLCREYEISRKTGYKFWDRYQREGPEGLWDESRRPAVNPNRTSLEITERILVLKGEKPSWGASKIREWLGRRHPGVRIPARSTVHEILARRGLVKRRKRRRRGGGFSVSVAQSTAPNDLWGTDFKGKFRMGNRVYCFPLTISDHWSRYLLGCEGMENERGSGAQGVFREVFREHGLPWRIRSDNGAPFASTGLLGLSPLSVWFLRLNIRVERIEPGHPEQNGRQERIHLTLKQATIRPAAANLLQQQERFDGFKQEYNEERPHEALGMRCPAEVYQPSVRPYPEELPEPEYPLHDFTRRVLKDGHVPFLGRGSHFYLCQALAGQWVGFREEEDDLWRVNFMDLDLGFYDRKERVFAPIEVPRSSFEET